MDWFIAFICGAISLALISGLVLSASFRDALLGGEGEATVLGLITVKGVAIVLLCSLFLGGMLYPLHKACKAPIEKIEALLHAKFVYEVENAANRRDRSALKDMVEKLQAAVIEAKQCY